MRFFSALLLLGLASASALLAPVSRAVAPPRTAAPLMKEAVTRIEIEVEQGEPLEKARAPPGVPRSSRPRWLPRLLCQ